MSNGYLAKYLAKEKGISIEEAQKVCEERKKFRKYFKEVNEDENYREEWSKSKNPHNI